MDKAIWQVRTSSDTLAGMSVHADQRGLGSVAVICLISSRAELVVVVFNSGVRDGGRGIPLAWNAAEIQTREQFGAVLTAIRERGGLSLRSLSRAVGMSTATLGGWCKGTNVPTVEAAQLFKRVLEECGAAEQFAGLWEAANRLRKTSRTARQTASPYRSLEPYRREDAALFFGRDDVVADLGAIVANGLTGHGPRLIGLLGASGSGKSSLLQAGLLANLEAPAAWMAPGADPAARLDEALAAIGDRATGAVLVVDQAEELWTYASTSESCYVRITPGAFVDRLVTLSGEGVVVVIALRSDFFGRALDVPALKRALTVDAVAVGPMSREQLEEAIVQPARARGEVVVESALVAVLQQELLASGGGAHDPGALPLLSHSLHASWIGRTDGYGLLTVADYNRTGGIRAAIEQTAETVWEELDSEQERAACERLFVRAVHRGDTVWSRTSVDPGELQWPDIAPGVTAAVIDRFVAARLLTTTTVGLGTLENAGHRVQITHEALIHAWKRLNEWLVSVVEGHAQHMRLAELVRDWDRDDPSTLLTSARTEEYQLWSRNPVRAQSITVTEREFLLASGKHQLETARAELWRLRRLYALSIALFLVAIVSIAASLVAWRSTLREADQYRVSHAHEQAAASYTVRSGSPDIGGLLAVQALRGQPDVQTRSALLETQADRFLGRIQASDTPLYGVASSPDGALIATSSYDGKARLFDARTRRELHQWSTGSRGGSAMSFSHDGSRVANAEGGTLRVWNTVDYTKVAELQGIEGGMSNIAFSPNKPVLAAFTENENGPNDIRLFDANTLASLPAPRGDISDNAGALAFSADTGAFAVAGTGPVQMWRSLDADPITLDRPWSNKVVAMAFSRDGRHLAVSNGHGGVTWWDLFRGGREVQTLQLDGDTAVWGLDFTSDGTTLAIGLDDRSVRLFDTATGGETYSRLLGHSSSIHRIGFTDDGTRLLTASSDGSVGVWDTSDLALMAVHPSSPATAMARSAHGATVAVAAADGSLHRFNPTTGTQRVVDPRWRDPSSVAFADDDRAIVVGGKHGLSVLDSVTSTVLELSARPIVGIAVSADTRILAVAFDDDVLARWDTRGWQRLADISVPAGVVLTSVAFGGNTMLAATSYTNHLVVWDVASADLRPVGQVQTEVVAAAFSPDKRFIAYATQTGQIKLFDLEANPGLNRTPDQELGVPHPIAGGGATAGLRQATRALAFSPNSQVLAATSDDGLTRIWRADHSNEFFPDAILRGHQSATVAAVFERDSTHLVTAGKDGVVRRWDLDVASVVSRVCNSVATADSSRWLERDTALLDQPHSC